MCTILKRKRKDGTWSYAMQFRRKNPKTGKMEGHFSTWNSLEEAFAFAQEWEEKFHMWGRDIVEYDGKYQKRANRWERKKNKKFEFTGKVMVKE